MTLFLSYYLSSATVGSKSNGVIFEKFHPFKMNGSDFQEVTLPWTCTPPRFSLVKIWKEVTFTIDTLSKLIGPAGGG